MSPAEKPLRIPVPSGSAPSALRTLQALVCMPAGDGEPLELCEECGSPLVDRSCLSCGSGFRAGTGPVGEAPLDRGELKKVLGRPASRGMVGSYSLSMQQKPGMAPLRREIDLLVNQFKASPEVKASVKHNAERLAVKIMGELGPTKAAIASVAQEFICRGKTLAEVGSRIARVHSGMDRLKDLVVEVYASPEGEVRVLVGGRERPFRSYSTDGLCRRLRIPVFASDGSALVELRHGRMTRSGYDEKRIRPLGPAEFVIISDDRNFELFKLIKEARLSGNLAGPGEADQKAASMRYSISKLPLTERLLRETGLLQAVSAEYKKRLDRALENGHGSSPRKLAEKALEEACRRVVSTNVSGTMVQKYRLKPSAMESLIVRRELEAWQRERPADC